MKNIPLWKYLREFFRILSKTNKPVDDDINQLSFKYIWCKTPLSETIRI